MTQTPRFPLAVVAGTRPEHLKLAPVAAALTFPVAWLWTGQQSMPRSSCSQIVWRALPPPQHPLPRKALERELERHVLTALEHIAPGAVLVQGDTASALAGALAARRLELPVIHLEAGLRSGSLRSPFPEELYRRIISRIARWHLTPSRRAREALLSEGVDSTRIIDVGSTAVDAVRGHQAVIGRRGFDLVVDVHRRENAGRAHRALAMALRRLAGSGWRIGVLRQPNPRWDAMWKVDSDGRPPWEILPPLSQAQWFATAQAAGGVLSDSGGVAEELPYLGVPLLIYRRAYERVEALEQGRAIWLDPGDPTPLDVRIDAALSAGARPAPWAFHHDSPYGDGRAGQRVAAALCMLLADGVGVSQANQLVACQ